MGYDPDRLYYRGFQKARKFWELPIAGRVEFCRSLFLGALKQEPSTYIRHVLEQTNLFWGRPYARTGLFPPRYWEDLHSTEAFLKRPRYLSPVLAERYQTVLADARRTLEGDWPSPLRLAVSLRVKVLIDALRVSFAVSVLGSVLFIGVVAAVRKWRDRIAWRPLLPVLSLATWALGSAIGSALTSSVAQALEIQRYVDLFMPVSLLSQLLWPVLGLSILLSLLKGQTSAAQ
jgi:hypothetical protein